MIKSHPNPDRPIVNIATLVIIGLAQLVLLTLLVLCFYNTVT